METVQTQMNVRLNAERKAAGDAVLAKFGLSPTYAVRALWDYLAMNKALPAFMVVDHDGCNTNAPTLADLAEEGAGLAILLAQEKGLAYEALKSMSFKELRETAYEERFDEWESLGV